MMKITKYGHACLLLENKGVRLLIDPGSFTELPNELPKVDFIVVTEEHYDHYNLDNLLRVAKNNPLLQIYTTTSLYKNMKKAQLNVQAIDHDQTVKMDVYNVGFSETDHAIVYQKSPCKSLAITVNNDLLYYPSDSYQVINKKVQVLALPTSGPWFKVSECIDFVHKVDSQIILTTHNALNSETGDTVIHNYIVNNINPDRKLIHLKDGESLDI